jgi:lipid A ethanolaminephosphotransferase
VGAYFMWSYHVVIDSTMLANVLQTDRHETAALMSPRLIAAVVGLAVVPGWWVWRSPLRFAPSAGRQAARNGATAAAALLVVVLAALAVFQPLASAMRNHKQLRYLLNPLNAVYAVGQTVAQPFKRERRRVPIGEDARVAVTGDRRPSLLVLVLGETARADHIGLNGYARDTTPRLAQAGAVSWRNAWSCGTSTAASVPCMYSHLGRQGFAAREHDYENLMDVLQRAGLAVLWLDNQSGCKGVCDRVPNVNTSQLTHPLLCPGGECHDGIQLEGLQQRIDALPPERRARGVVLVMHQMGSHGPAYSQRSPAAAKPFTPECTSVNLQECSAMALVNAYDNSIAYTDQVLGDTIAWLERQAGAFDTALLYVSDHGESLGENNLYLHGLPYAIAPDVQKHVPWITWVSAGFARRSGVGPECLHASRDTRVSHDNYFHAVLGLVQVQTRLYRRELDPYAACGAH